MDNRNSILDRAFQALGGQNMNPGQQIAFNQVGGDLGFSPQDIALELTKKQSADAINSSLGITSNDTIQTSERSASLKGFPITQGYGNVNPGIERFSGGVNTGVDIGVPANTPIGLPSGKWKVVSAFNGAKNGYIGDNENSGYGNSVLVQNIDTGEKLRFSHLNSLNIPSGDVNGGHIIGLSGATGNVTGPHLDLEYYDKNGHLGDFMQTQYAQELGL